MNGVVIEIRNVKRRIFVIARKVLRRFGFCFPCKEVPVQFPLLPDELCPVDGVGWASGDCLLTSFNVLVGGISQSIFVELTSVERSILFRDAADE